MGLFQTREPRKYRHISIYTSESQDKIDKIVRQVKRERGELPPTDIDPDTFKGKFSKFTPRAQKASESEHKLTWPLALILIILLIFVWHYLLTGKVSF